MIEINCKEFEEMAMALNWNKNSKMAYIGGVIVTIIAFFIFYETRTGFFYYLFASLIAGATYYFTFKIIMNGISKKVNMTNTIVKIEQEICEDHIKEKVIKEKGNEATYIFKYKEVIKIKENKKYIFLYITKLVAVIISKDKINDVIKFKEMVLKHMQVQ